MGSNVSNVLTFAVPNCEDVNSLVVELEVLWLTVEVKSGARGKLNIATFIIASIHIK
jgi:hypothetical protein